MTTLFEAAAELYRAAPWKTLRNGDVLVVDCAALGLVDARVSVMGNAKDQYGFLLFDDEHDLDLFIEYASVAVDAPRTKLTTAQRKVGYLALDFSPRDQVGIYAVKRMRELTPPDAEDARTLAVVTEGIVAFWGKHGATIRSQEDDDELAHSVTTEAGIEITVSGPLYDGDEEMRHFAIDLPMPLIRPGAAAPSTPRNAQCPCGSGKKYKVCHLEKDAAALAPSPELLNFLRERLDARLLRFGRSLFREEFLDLPGLVVADLDDDDLTIAPVLVAFASHHFVWDELEGRTVGDAYLATHRDELEPAEFASLEAHKQAWLSLWQVTAVVPGESVTLLDLLTDETRTVVERTASRTLRVHMIVLAYIVDFAESSQLYGMYGRPLPVDIGEPLAMALRKALLPKQKKGTSAERLRELPAQARLLDAFVDAMNAVLHAPAPELITTSGEPLLVTIDHFAIVSGDTDSHVDALVAAGFADDGSDEQPRRLRLLDGNSIVGMVDLSPAALMLQTMSIARADRVRAIVEKALGGSIHHRLRTHSDPAATMDRPHSEHRAPEPMSPGLAAQLAQIAAAHWRTWCDQPVPALANKTPRQAARTKVGRPKLLRLLRDFETRSTPGDPLGPDLVKLRAELGLGPDER
ncbi:MAG: SEC-C domain-containing protein [Polyangia bacterium]